MSETNEEYATVSWCVLDLTEQYGLTQDQAVDVLNYLSDDLHEAMVQAGWEFIDLMLPELGYGRCDTCRKIYDTSSRDGRCGDCGNCGEHCECLPTCECECGCEVPLISGTCVDCSEANHQNNNSLEQYMPKDK